MAKAKKPAGAKQEPKRKPPSAAAGSPLIDPSKSAAAAAAMVAHKVSVPTSQDSAQAQSSTFAKLKESLKKPHAQTMGSLLDKLSAPGQKKSAMPFAGGKQVGHNQTFGSDASRRNVPRRTGG
jgi:hypothetical protein